MRTGRPDRVSGTDMRDDRQSRNSKRVTLEIMRDTGRFFALYAGGGAAGLVEDNDAAHPSLFGLAERALRVGDDPPRLFASLVNRGQWNFVAAEDEDAANARLKTFLYGNRREGDGDECLGPEEVRRTAG